MKQLAAAEKKEEFNPNVLDAMKESCPCSLQEPSRIVTDTAAFMTKIPKMISR